MRTRIAISTCTDTELPLKCIDGNGKEIEREKDRMREGERQGDTETQRA